MTISQNRSSTFSYNDAVYVASKLGADLRNLNARYGQPSLASIEEYVAETALFLKAGYLDKVDFGFKDGDRWVLRLRYTAVAGGQLRDETPGGLPSAATVAGYPFYSYMTTNSAYSALTAANKSDFENTLPFVRVGAPEPTAYAGSHSASSQYSRHGTGLSRGVYTAH